MLDDLLAGQGRPGRRQRPGVHRGGPGRFLPDPAGAGGMAAAPSWTTPNVTASCRWWRSLWRRPSGCSANKDRESNVFPRVARRDASSAWACAVTQQPKLLDDELLSQFNTFFVLGLADEKDRNILRSSAKQDHLCPGPRSDPDAGRVSYRQPGGPFAVPAPSPLRRRVRSAPPAPAPEPSRRPTCPPWWTEYLALSPQTASSGVAGRAAWRSLLRSGGNVARPRQLSRALGPIEGRRKTSSLRTAVARSARSRPIGRSRPESCAGRSNAAHAL